MKLAEVNLMNPSVGQIVRIFKEDPLLALLHDETVLLVVVERWKGVRPQIGALHDWLKDLEDPKLADWDVELLADILPGINGTLSVGKSKLATIGNHHATNQTIAHLETLGMTMVCWTKRENDDVTRQESLRSVAESCSFHFLCSSSRLYASCSARSKFPLRKNL